MISLQELGGSVRILLTQHPTPSKEGWKKNLFQKISVFYSPEKFTLLESNYPMGRRGVLCEFL